MTSQPIAINVKKAISVWLDVTLPVIDPTPPALCTRRPLQVLWMRSARSPGEVKHRLLPRRELPRTNGGRRERRRRAGEITACDSWLHQRLPASANVLLIYPSQMLSGFFLFLFIPFSVSKLIIFFQVPGRQRFDTEISRLLWFDKTLQKITSGQKNK